MFGSILAASTRRAAQILAKVSIPCIGGTKLRQSAMHTSWMSRPMDLAKMRWNSKLRIAYGSPVAGHYRNCSLLRTSDSTVDFGPLWARSKPSAEL